MAKNRIGLVLGSGGMRGLSHISVIEYLSENGIRPDLVVGASIGSIMGALYCAGKLEEFKNDFFSMSKRQVMRYFYPAISRSGLLNADKIIDFLKGYIPANAKIEDFDIPLAIVATDFETGRTVVFRNGKVLAAVRASISIPGVFIPVHYKNSLLIDGGVSNPLPIDVAKSMGAEKIIAVNLQPDLGTKKKSVCGEKKDESASSSGITPLQKGYVDMIKNSWHSNVNTKWLSSWFETGKKQKKDLPNMFDIAVQSIQILMWQNTKLILREHKPDVLIEPETLDINILEFSKSKKAYHEGFKACERVKPAILKLFRMTTG
jgi:NTE family protein